MKTRNSKSKKPTEKPAKPKAKLIKELAQHFEEDLNKSLPISIQPDGSVVYKQYLIKQDKTGSWALVNISSRDVIETFYLKTSAIMAARSYGLTNLEKFFEIKQLDSRYWSNFMDSEVSRKNMAKEPDLSRYIILLNRFENSQQIAEICKEDISRMFRWSFV
jgi:hypothetical protein